MNEIYLDVPLFFLFIVLNGKYTSRILFLVLQQSHRYGFYLFTLLTPRK